MDIVTYALAKKLVKNYKTGNVTVEKGTTDTEYLILTAQKGTGDESKVTYTKDELRGLGVESISKDSDGNCIVTYTDGTTQNIGSFKGDKGDVGDKGEKGDKGDTGLGIESIETTESTLDSGSNIVTVTLTDDTTKSFKILNGSKGDKGDTGVSLDDVKLIRDTTDKTNHLQVKFDNETSYTDLGRVQGKSNYEIALDNGFVGNEDEYLKSLTAQTTESKIVTSKPRIEDSDTALGVWYYWQDNAEGTTDTAYKYRLDIPSTQDLVHGKYCFYYNLKWFISEPTQDVLALTNKDTYNYYLIMDLLDVSYDIIQETIADGTTVVLEHVQGSISTTAPTSDYTPISSSALKMLGVQCQTLYIGSTKETANEVTIRTGTDVKGFVTSGAFQSIVGDKSDLATLNNDNIVSAINEVKSDVDVHKDDTDIHITTDERTKWNNTADKVGGADLVKKSDIATTISETPSDEKVASEKAVSDIIPFKFGIDDNGNYGYYKAGADTVTPFKSSVELEDTGKIYGKNGRIKLIKMGNLRYFDSVNSDWIETGMNNIVLDEEDRPLSNTTIKGSYTGNGRDWAYGTIVIGTDGTFTLSQNNYFTFANCHWIAKD